MNGRFPVRKRSVQKSEIFSHHTRKNNVIIDKRYWNFNESAQENAERGNFFQKMDTVYDVGAI
jgi:hypothetical protein